MKITPNSNCSQRLSCVIWLKLIAKNLYRNIQFTRILSYLRSHCVSFIFWNWFSLLNLSNISSTNYIVIISNNSQLLLGSILQHKAEQPNHHVEQSLLYYFLLWITLGPIAQYDFENWTSVPSHYRIWNLKSIIQ